MTGLETVFMEKLSEVSNHMKPQQNKEFIKVYGKASQIFEEAIVPTCIRCSISYSRRPKKAY